MKNFFKSKIAIAIFVLSFFWIGQDLDKPFWGEHDWNGVRYGNIARNYLRYGVLETKLGQVENSGQAKPDNFEYYTRYPPLLPFLIAISYKIFGISEWSTRLVPLVFTSASLVMIFLIGSGLFSLRVGILATLLALGTPMVGYFGKNPSHESLTLFFILLAFYGYVSAKNSLFVSGLILAQISAWAGYFLLPALTVSHLLQKDFKSIKKLIPLWILSAGIFTIHLLQVNWLTGSISGGDLFGTLWQRAGLASSLQPEGFNLINYLGRVRLWLSTLFTNTLLLVALFHFFNKKLLPLALVGVFYALFFSSSVYIHSYLLFYFLPFLTLAAAATFWHFQKLLKKGYLVLAAVLLLAVFWERNDFLQALQKSNMDELAVRVGVAIREQTKIDDTVLIQPAKFIFSADKFLRFYGDRKLIYSDDDRVPHDVKVTINQNLSKFEIMRK